MFVRVILASATALLYQNDFSIRTSAEPPGSAWAVYEYDKGGPIAYDYDPVAGFNYYTGFYPDGSSAVYSQQDGWMKGRAVSDSAEFGSQTDKRNRVRSSVSNEDDPALVFSDEDTVSGGVGQPATNHDTSVIHMFRNFFENGTLRAQFDIRIPAYQDDSARSRYTWFRFVYNSQAKNKVLVTSDRAPMELGAEGKKTLSGTWLSDVNPQDGTRKDYSLKGDATPGNWYRCSMTCDLDTEKSSLEIYDLGNRRIPMDAQPGGSPVVTRTGLPFTRKIAAGDGIVGLAIRIAKCPTGAYYGEAGYDPDKSYMYDNIKVAWKKPNTDTFVEFYRNDFAKSMRRSVDGRDGTSFTYGMSSRSADVTFTYQKELIRRLDDRSTANGTTAAAGKPVLTQKWAGNNKVQPVGIDGWRSAGNSGYYGPMVLTTNGSNRVGFLPRVAMVIQPMCDDVTNGLTRFEYDIRMPKGWNGNTTYVPLSLISNKGYDEEYNFMNNMTLLRVGPDSSTGSKGDGTLSFITSNKDYLSGSYHGSADKNENWSDRFEALKWYHVQIFIDLDQSKYYLRIYDVGTSAPTTPGTYDAATAANLIVSSMEYDLYYPSDDSRNPQKRYGKAIGAYGFTNWNDASGDAGYGIYVDNIEFWQQTDAANNTWKRLFQNTFSTTTRSVTRQDIRLNSSGIQDRPEINVDNWASMPRENSAIYVAGTNQALETCSSTYSLVQPLGRAIRSGTMTAQYDVRVPIAWPLSQEQFRFQLGSGVASASTWTGEHHYLARRAICTGIQATHNASGAVPDAWTGLYNRTGIVAFHPKATGTGEATEAAHDSGAYADHWLRIRIEVDLDAKTWGMRAYDMGTAQPDLNTPDGALVSGTATWNDFKFLVDEPITHLHIKGGVNDSYAPWRGDLPGAILVDNIKVCHDKSGLSVFIR